MARLRLQAEGTGGQLWGFLMAKLRLQAEGPGRTALGFPDGQAVHVNKTKVQEGQPLSYVLIELRPH
jgi:hypothetical protein